jgi:hypothetical protein
MYVRKLLTMKPQETAVFTPTVQYVGFFRAFATFFFYSGKASLLEDFSMQQNFN